MDLYTAYQIVKFVCERCETPELANGINIAFVDNFKSTLADASYDGRRRGEVRISNYFWDIISPEQQVELIIHETCHIIHDYKYLLEDDRPHGKRWKILMRCAGIANPQAVFVVEGSGKIKSVLLED